MATARQSFGDGLPAGMLYFGCEPCLKPGLASGTPAAVEFANGTPAAVEFANGVDGIVVHSTARAGFRSDAECGESRRYEPPDGRPPARFVAHGTISVCMVSLSWYAPL